MYNNSSDLKETVDSVLMQDYEDDVPWEGSFDHYYPTYHDMNTRQLRGYFTWRARLRRGDVQPIPTSAAYLYIYELLNGVGADTPEACLQKMREFMTAYLDAGFGDSRMRKNLRRWMLEFAVLHDLYDRRDRGVDVEHLPELQGVEALVLLHDLQGMHGGIGDHVHAGSASELSEGLAVPFHDEACSVAAKY